MSTYADTYAAVVARAVWEDTGYPAGPCLVWLGAVNTSGYGVIRHGAGYVLTHRAAVLTRDGAIPAGMTVDHLCYTRRCVAPTHLDVVPRATNARRAADRRRALAAR